MAALGVQNTRIHNTDYNQRGTTRLYYTLSGSM